MNTKKTAPVLATLTLAAIMNTACSNGANVEQTQSDQDNTPPAPTETTTVTLQNGQQVEANIAPQGINTVEIIGSLPDGKTIASVGADITVPEKQTADDLTFYTSGQLSALQLEGARNYVEANYADISDVLGNDATVVVETGARVHNIEGNDSKYSTIGQETGDVIGITTTPQGTGTEVSAPNVHFNDGTGNETTVIASFDNGHKGVVNVGRDIGFETTVEGAASVSAQSAACDFVMHSGGPNSTLNIGSQSTGYTPHHIGDNTEKKTIGELTNAGQIDYAVCYAPR